MVCACSNMAKVQMTEVKAGNLSTSDGAFNINTTTPISGLKQTGFAVWKAPRVDDDGVEAAATWQSIASTAVAAINAAAAFYIAKKQMDIAKEYLNLYKQQINRFFDKYAGCEAKFVDAVSAVEEYIWEYVSRGTNNTNRVENGISIADRSFNEFVKSSHICIDKSFVLSQGVVDNKLLSQAINIGVAQENATRLRKNDIRWMNRAMALNRGRSLLSMSTDAAGRGSDMYQTMYAGLEKAISGAAYAMGYFGTKNETSYPTGSTGLSATDSLYNTQMNYNSNIGMDNTSSMSPSNGFFRQ